MVEVRLVGSSCRKRRVALRLRVVAGVVLVVLAIAPLSATAARRTGGTGGHAEQAEAVRAIPFSQLKPDAAKHIHRIVTEPSVYRRLPQKTVDCDPTLYLFLVRNPEVIVSIWQLMEITQIEMHRVAPYLFTASDGAGTHSRIELVYGTPGVHVYVARGFYEGPLLKKRIHGDCVLLLRSSFDQAQNGRPRVTNTLDVFVQVEPGAVDLFARTFHPLFGQTADFNFLETANFIGQLSRTAELNKEGVTNLARRVEGLQPDVRHQFATVVSGMARDATPRVAERAVADAQERN